MRIFALRHDWLRSYPDEVQIPIDATAASVSVPLVDCPECGRGWGSAVRYPFFRPDQGGSPRMKKLWRRRGDHDVVPRDPSRFWLWLEEFRQAMAEECPGVTWITCASGFGPLRLVVEREVDLAQVGCGAQLVARAPIVHQLQSQGVKLQTCLTLLRPPRDRSSDEFLEMYQESRSPKALSEPYRELFAPPIARKAASSHGELCRKCFRCDKEWDWTDPMPVLAGSIPTDRDLFRLVERPGAVLATERFVEAVSGLRTWEVTWQPVEVERGNLSAG